MLKRRRISKKVVLISLAIVASLIAIFAFLELSNRTHFFGEDKSVTSNAQTTSDLPTAQEDFSGGDDTKTPNSAVTNNDGGIIDTQGTGVPSTPATNPVVSTSGNISVLTPAPGQTIQPGSTVSGYAKVSEVQYRLVDNSAGVIAQGSLAVVNGKFSGTLQFAKRGTSGTLKFFSNEPGSSVEVNKVEINVAL